MIHRFLILSPLLLHSTIFLVQVSDVAAFVAIHRGSDSKLLSASQSTIKAVTVKLSPVMLGVSNQRLDEDVDSDSEKSLESLPATKSHEQKLNQARWKQLKEINNMFWDYTCNFLYVGISCLILLNVCGFGYTISAEEGLNVMPLNTYRQQRQWQQEIQRLQNQPFPSSLSQIQLPVAHDPSPTNANTLEMNK